MKPPLVVVLEDESCRERAAQIAKQVGVPVAASGRAVGADLCLFVGGSGLALGRAGAGRERSAVRWNLRRAGGGKRDPLLRAVGPPARRVLDATAGFGNDAFMLAENGYAVVACERSNVVAALLEDGLARALEDPRLSATATRITLETSDARDLMERDEAGFETIYLDPMYPPKRKRSALPRLEMQLLQELVGADEDVEALFAAARRFARERVVVKRPHHAPPLAEAPSAQYRGKLVRYDVYRRT